MSLNRSDEFATLLWLHGLWLHCAAASGHLAEWEHYNDRAARVAAQISEHIVREEETCGAV